MGITSLVFGLALIGIGISFVTIPVFAEVYEVRILKGSSTQGCEQTDSCLNPSHLTITQGDTVNWIREEDVAHFIQSYTGSQKNWATQEYTHTFSDIGTFNYEVSDLPWIQGVIVVEYPQLQTGNYIDFTIVELRGNELYLEYEGHLNTNGGIFNIYEYTGAHVLDHQFSADKDGSFSGVIWSEKDAYRSWDVGIYRVKLLYHDEITNEHILDYETTFKLEEKPSGNFQHTIQILDGSMDKKCGNDCVDPPVLHIQRGDRITFSHNDCTGCHHMALDHPDIDEPYFPDYNKFRFWEIKTWTHYDVLHPWITGQIIVQTEKPSLVSKEKIIPEPESIPEPIDNSLREQITELKMENRDLKMQIDELNKKIENLNQLILEQLKVIYDWVVSK